MTIKIDSRELLFILILNALCPNVWIFKQSFYFFLNFFNGRFLNMQLIAWFEFTKVRDVLIIFFERMIHQLSVFPFPLLSFVPAIDVFSNDDQCNLFKPFHIRKSVYLQDRKSVV